MNTVARLGSTKANRVKLLRRGAKRKKKLHKSDIFDEKIYLWAVLSTPETASITEEVSSSGKCCTAQTFWLTS